MNKKDIIEFFDNCAPWWDEDMIRQESIISKILDNAGVCAEKSVLDVACGTGVLFPDYLQRNVKSVTAIDISPKMVEIARQKSSQIQVVCGDVEEFDFDKQFDVIMIYNAFPHFPKPTRLIEVLAGITAPNGRISIAHSMSREALHEHHKRAEHVSLELPETCDLAKMLEPYFNIESVVSNEEMYQVVGIKK